MKIVLDESRALQNLIDLLAIEGLSGHEGAIVEAIRAKLQAAGVPAAWIRTDAANARIAKALGRPASDFETGNLIVRWPGTRPGPRRMFLGHMDTVPLCRGARPVRRGNFIRPASKTTALGADNRVAVAALVTLVETLLREKWPHPPLTILFTICEEIGLYGAKHLRLSDVGHPAMAFNIDSGDPARLVVGAIGAVKWTAHIHGISSHAGVHPERGVSAVLIAARAIERVAARGYFGAIRKGARRGTANAGIIHGGEATNQVTHHVEVRGECRSHDPSFLRVITREWREAFERAARSVRNREGQRGRVELEVRSDYASFRLPDSHPAVRFALAQARAVGLRPRAEIMDGGLDANPLNDAGVPTITLGAGQHNPHSTDEHVNIPEFLDGCRLVLQLAVAEDPSA